MKFIISGCLLCWLGSTSTALAQWPGSGAAPYAQLGAQPGANSLAGAAKPHPAVARIIVPERDGTSYGSGTLVDVRDQYGLVITNWHVVRDASDRIEVVFPDGYRSFGQALKVDKDWDLAALVIWKPQASPVPLAAAAPQPGDVLTIAGYGKGTYRALTGRCTQYLSPTVQLPREMVEVSVAARQGDSGGPIFNTRGELAGVLWGAGSATTLGSYAGRVGGFLASVAPHLGTSQPQTQIAARLRDAPPLRAPFANNPAQGANAPGQHASAAPYVSPSAGGLVAVPAGNVLAEGDVPLGDAPAEQLVEVPSSYAATVAESQPDTDSPAFEGAEGLQSPVFRQEFAAKSRRTGELPPTAALVQADEAADAETVVDVPITWQDFAGESYFDQAKTVLAMLGVLAVVVFCKRNMGG